MERVGWAVGLAALVGCAAGEALPDRGAPSCTVVAAAGAEHAAGRDGRWVVLPDGRRLTPTGVTLALGGFPLGMAVVPGGRLVVVGDAGYGEERLRVVDVQARVVVSELSVPSHFLGLAVSDDGLTLYASSPEDRAVLVFDVGSGGELSPRDRFPAGDFPAGLALASDGESLLVALQLADQVAVLDRVNGSIKRRIAVGKRPYQVIAAPATRASEAYVSLWGGGAVAVIDPGRPTPLATVATGKNPSAMTLSPSGDRLYVANGDDDTVSVIDLDQRRVALTAPLGGKTLGALPGISPSDLALSPDGSRLYLAAAGANAVLALAAADLKPLGALPTGWYPTSLVVLPSGALAVANGKGEGPGPNVAARYIPLTMGGTLSLLEPPDDGALADGSRAVAANNGLPRTREAAVTCTDPLRPFPVPLGSQRGGPIEHVVLIVRENKTYDAELGDLETGNGDPKLVLFGEQVTPNLHALAREFANLDNFYSDAEASIQGHAWTTAATANDFVEKVWFTEPGYRLDLRPGKDLLSPTARPAYGSFFDRLEEANIDFVVWGEIVGFRTDLGRHFDGGFPGLFFNLDVSDVEKAEYVADRIRDERFLPRFTYLLLPRNHTFGTTPGKPTPQVMVADNDVATGLVVDAIAHSKFWPATVIFIIEDDPQDGGDHVEAHRSICLVVSPYARRHATIKSHFDYASLYRTIELLVGGVGPMNRADAQAAAMLEPFTSEPDTTPWEARPSTIAMTAINSVDDPGALESQSMDFSAPDRARGLGEVLWRSIKKTDPPRNEPDVDED